MQIKSILFIYLVLYIAFAGSQPHGAWIKCMQACAAAGSYVAMMTFGVAGILFGVGCYAICGPGTSLVRCFEQNTFILTKEGEVAIKDLKKGDIILTSSKTKSEIV